MSFDTSKQRSITDFVQYAQRDLPDKTTAQQNIIVDEATGNKMVINADGSINAGISGSDIEIGAVEIKNATDDTRAIVNTDGSISVKEKTPLSGFATSTKQSDGSQKTQIVDATGNIIDTIQSGTKDALMVAIGPTNYTTSTNNSSIVQLASQNTFTGTIETCFNEPAVSVLLTTDQPGTLTVNQYIDLAGTRKISSWLFYINANIPYSRSFVANGNYINFTFTNTGASITTTFNLNVAYGAIAPTTNLGNNPAAINEVNGTAITGSSVPVVDQSQIDTVILLRRLVKILESNATVDASNRQKVNVDAVVGAITTLGVAVAGVNTPISSAAPTQGAVVYWQPCWIGPVDQRWEFIDRARTAYNLGVRNQLAFT